MSQNGKWTHVASDNAETPAEAYADLAPVLCAFSEVQQKSPASLRIYDPYFCAGTAAVRLANAGFPTVKNVQEDFYSSKAYIFAAPTCDVVVTNPPFSGSHIPRLLGWVARLKIPAALLLPQHVATKRAWREFKSAAVNAGRPEPIYIGPRAAAYEFETPVSNGPVKRAGCFQCVWFIVCATHAQHEAVIKAWRRSPPPAAALAEGDPKSLPQLTITSRITPAERRWRKKLRGAKANHSSAV